MKYVCTGAILRCSMGTATCKLRATPKRVTLMGEDQANVNDFVSKVNVPGFGLCRSLKYPPTASATAAHHGRLTPMPCVPGTCPKWKVIDKYSLICGEPALLQPSTLRCVYGGTISIVAPGQQKEIKVMAAALAAEEAIQEVDQLSDEELTVQMQQDSEQLVNEPLDKQGVVEGIHTVLDLAGFVPGLGAIPDILNAAVYAAEGNFGMAAFSVLAAVPGVGDVAAAGKIAYKGVKVAQRAGKVAQKTGKVAKNTGKVAQNLPSKTDNVVPISSAPSASRNVNSNASGVIHENNKVEKATIYRINRKEQKVGNGENRTTISVEKYDVIKNSSEDFNYNNPIDRVSRVQPVDNWIAYYFNKWRTGRDNAYPQNSKGKQEGKPKGKQESLLEKLNKLDEGKKLKKTLPPGVGEKLDLNG